MHMMREQLHQKSKSRESPKYIGFSRFFVGCVLENFTLRQLSFYRSKSPTQSKWGLAAIFSLAALKGSCIRVMTV